MSGQVPEAFEALNKKLHELLEKYKNLSIKNEDLEKENDVLKRYLSEKDQEIKNLGIKYEKIKISGALMGEGESATEAKKRINELVREIDRCVALLNR